MDNLYKKSIAALLAVLVSGIAVFFYATKKGVETMEESSEKELASVLEQSKNEQPKNNLPTEEILETQEMPPEISGFDDISEEIEALDNLLLDLE